MFTSCLFLFVYIKACIGCQVYIEKCIQDIYISCIGLHTQLQNFIVWKIFKFWGFQGKHNYTNGVGGASAENNVNHDFQEDLSPPPFWWNSCIHPRKALTLKRKVHIKVKSFAIFLQNYRGQFRECLLSLFLHERICKFWYFFHFQLKKRLLNHHLFFVYLCL